MSNLTDFNDRHHRIQSASAVFQKGLYHLFVLKDINQFDYFDQIIRKYQCLFQICLTQLLLDEDYVIPTDKILKRLKELCSDPRVPDRRCIDPAALVNHTVFEDPTARNAWNGFHITHPLQAIGIISLNALRRIVETRHNLVYRPFMLDNLFWRDSTLIELLKQALNNDEIEQIYSKFSQDVLRQYALEQEEKRHRFENMQTPLQPKLTNPLETKSVVPLPILWADTFLQYVFWVFEDQKYSRPTDTVLSSYTRMLRPNDDSFVQNLLKYRNNLLEVERIAPTLHHPQEWHVGEV